MSFQDSEMPLPGHVCSVADELRSAFNAVFNSEGISRFSSLSGPLLSLDGVIPHGSQCYAVKLRWMDGAHPDSEREQPAITPRPQPPAKLLQREIPPGETLSNFLRAWMEKAEIAVDWVFELPDRIERAVNHLIACGFALTGVFSASDCSSLRSSPVAVTDWRKASCPAPRCHKNSLVLSRGPVEVELCFITPPSRREVEIHQGVLNSMTSGR